MDNTNGCDAKEISNRAIRCPFRGQCSGIDKGHKKYLNDLAHSPDIV